MSDITNPESLGPTNSLSGAVDPEAIKRGHEADGYDQKSVLSVPLLVVVFFLLAFGCVTTIFWFVSKPEQNPDWNPQAVAENDQPLNDRLGAIHRTAGGPSDQPRLEILTLREGDPRAITEPKTPHGNSPELHPEDIHVSRKNTPELYEVGPLAHDSSASRITIDDAMRQALGNKNFFPTAAAGTAPPNSSHVPTASNGGRGADEAKAEPPKLPEQGGKK